MAEYYEQGVTPPMPADAAASRYGHLAVEGHLPLGDVLDELVNIEPFQHIYGLLEAPAPALRVGIGFWTPCISGAG